MKILKVIDQWGWAYHNVSKDQQKHSRHEIDIVRIEDFSIDRASDKDIVYFSSVDLDRNAVMDSVALLRRELPLVKIIGGYAGESNLIYQDCDLVISVSLNHYYKLLDMYPDKKVIWLPESIDTEYFKRTQDYPDTFSVGWAGRDFPVKRPHLLRELRFPLKIKSDWGMSFFKEDRSLGDMIEFYHSISALVLVSLSECMPRVVLEAMSMGLPVVSTDVGSLGVVLQKEMLVPAMPEHAVMPRINGILGALRSDLEFYQTTCRRNLKTVNEKLSWANNMPYWDNVFDAVLDEDSKRIGEVERYFQSIFKLYFSRLGPAGRICVNR